MSSDFRHLLAPKHVSLILHESHSETEDILAFGGRPSLIFFHLAYVFVVGLGSNPNTRLVPG